jgi:DNA-binding CsgD family transcriptional regulator
MEVYVRSDDVRALLKLVGEARELLDAGECPRAHVLQGLMRLAGASVGVAFSGDHLRAAAPRFTEYLDHGWTADESKRVIAYYGARSGADDPIIGNLLRAQRNAPLVTVRRSDLVGNKAWYASALHNELHRPGRLDDVIMSVRFLGGSDEAVSALVFKRAAGDPPFSIEERELLHLFQAESDWIFRRESRPPQDLIDGLTRREQETLGLLLTDASEKEVAARLGISPHTVHDYVKRLYRKIGVSSRAALMAWSSGLRRRSTVAV